MAWKDLRPVAGLFTGLLLAAAPAGATEAPAPVKPPPPVEKTFQAQFPKAEIQKLTSEVEEGVTVYDFEFKQGDTEKETDIAGDGTMLEWTLVIPQDSIPAPVMKVINASAKGAKLGRLERIEVSYGLEDAKIVKLAKPLTRYAAEMTRGDQMAEVIVNSDGTVFEKPVWVTSGQLAPAVK